MIRSILMGQNGVKKHELGLFVIRRNFKFRLFEINFKVVLFVAKKTLNEKF